MEDFNTFHHPKLGWIEFDKSEIYYNGLEVYVNQLHSLGFDLAMSTSGKPKKLDDVLIDLPFDCNELAVYILLLEDGWKRMQMSHAEDLGVIFFLNSKVGRVNPLYKTFGNAKCVFDLNGFNWYIKSKKLVYGSPLPF